MKSTILYKNIQFYSVLMFYIYDGIRCNELIPRFELVIFCTRGFSCFPLRTHILNEEKSIKYDFLHYLEENAFILPHGQP